MRSRAGLVLVGVVGLCALVTASLYEQVRSRRPGPVPAHTPGTPDVAPEPTRIQIEVFELTCLPGELARLDATVVAKGDVSTEQAVKMLGEHGEARLLVRMDDVMDLRQSSRLNHGKRMPTVQDVAVSDKGVVSPSVTYQSVGFNADIQGQWWEDEQPTQADISVSIEFSTVIKGTVQVADKVTLPEFAQWSVKKRVTVTDGEPLVTMTNQLPDPFDSAGRIVVNVVRLTATRVGDAVEAADPDTKP